MLVTPDASEYTCKYGLMVLQFLLHSKSIDSWQLGADPETEGLTRLLLAHLTDIKRPKAQKQAIKIVCLLLRNRAVEK